MRCSLAIVGALALMLAPLSASAQEEQEQDLSSALTICGLVHLSLLTTVTPTTIFLPELVEHQTKRALIASALDRYLEEQPQAWAEVLALGAGAGLEDLGALLEVAASQQPSLGARLRQQRGALLAITHQPRGIARGQRLLAAFDELITEVER